MRVRSGAFASTPFVWEIKNGTDIEIMKRNVSIAAHISSHAHIDAHSPAKSVASRRVEKKLCPEHMKPCIRDILDELHAVERCA